VTPIEAQTPTAFYIIHVQEMASKSNKHIQRIYMIGDNVDTDVEGANRAGGKWVSVLTKTGLYVGGPHSAQLLVDDVGQAYDEIAKLHS
jgi:ribonucleotide monophosphatase NagD (HAD superfamily)